METDDLIRIVRIALATLSDRAAIFIAMFMQFSLAIWTAYDPATYRLVLIGLFGLTVFLPVLNKFGTKPQQ